MRLPALFLPGLLALLPVFGAPAAPDRPALVIVLVIDGLRPDSITAERTPNLNRLKQSGVWYTNAHSVFPTVTRVNTASISTGTLPARHGIVSNSLYLPAVSKTVVSNGDYRNLLTLGKQNGGRIVGPQSLGEFFEAAGIRYVAVSSGSTGNGVLLHPTAPYGKGLLINPGFENGARVAFPDSLNTALLTRYGVSKAEDGDAPMLWVERVLREYVLETMRPQVIIDWMGRTDSAQHEFGVGSPQGVAALRLVDEQIGMLLEQLRQRKLAERTDILVTCDHGFDYEPAADVLAPLRDSGLAAEDVVVDNEGGATLFYIKGHDAEKIARLAARLQEGPDTNAVFVASRRPGNGTFACSPGAEKGFAPGSFALELASQCLPEGGPDLIATWRWDGAANPFGVPGTQWVPGGPGSSQRAARNGHGGLNPYVTHSTLLAAGPDFAQGKTIDLPAGNQDIAPTLLSLEGLAVPATLDGRVLSEAFRKPPANSGRLKASTRRIRVTAGAFCAEIETSHAGPHTYLNQARRCSGKP